MKKTYIFLILLSFLAFGLTFSTPKTMAQNTTAKETAAKAEQQENDPCAEENKKYPWGMSPCKEVQIKRKIWKEEDPAYTEKKLKAVKIEEAEDGTTE